jgi:hypothetical protein
MNDQPIVVGRVLRSSTASFSLGCTRLIADQGQIIPEFGGLVKAVDGERTAVYGLIYNVTIEDDAFVRQLVAAGVENEEYIEDQRLNRQMPIVVDVLVAGHGRDGQVYHRLPPQPPGALDRILVCNHAEVVRFSARHDWQRIVLAAAEVPVDQLLVAALRKAAQARPPDQRELYLVAAGRELARLLALDLTRLDGILQQLRPDQAYA